MLPAKQPQNKQPKKGQHQKGMVFNWGPVGHHGGDLLKGVHTTSPESNPGRVIIPAKPSWPSCVFAFAFGGFGERRVPSIFQWKRTAGLEMMEVFQNPPVHFHLGKGIQSNPRSNKPAALQKDRLLSRLAINSSREALRKWLADIDPRRTSLPEWVGQKTSTLLIYHEKEGVILNDVQQTNP